MNFLKNTKTVQSMGIGLVIALSLGVSYATNIHKDNINQIKIEKLEKAGINYNLMKKVELELNEGDNSGIKKLDSNTKEYMFQNGFSQKQFNNLNHGDQIKYNEIRTQQLNDENITQKPKETEVSLNI